MSWNSWSDFAAMGGHGFYVWGSVLVVLAAVAIEVIEVVWRQRLIFRKLREAGG